MTHPDLDACSPAEIDAWEIHARASGLNMDQHPLHYLFTDQKTYAARYAWKAAIAFARAKTAEGVPSPGEAPLASPVRDTVPNARHVASQIVCMSVHDDDEDWIREKWKTEIDAAEVLIQGLLDERLAAITADARESHERGREFVETAYAKLAGDSLDTICDAGERIRQHNTGKSIMRQWFLGRLRRLWGLPEPKPEADQ